MPVNAEISAVWWRFDPEHLNSTTSGSRGNRTHNRNHQPLFFFFSFGDKADYSPPIRHMSWWIAWLWTWTNQEEAKRTELEDLSDFQENIRWFWWKSSLIFLSGAQKQTLSVNLHLLLLRMPPICGIAAEVAAFLMTNKQAAAGHKRMMWASGAAETVSEQRGKSSTQCGNTTTCLSLFEILILDHHEENLNHFLIRLLYL